MNTMKCSVIVPQKPTKGSAVQIQKAIHKCTMDAHKGLPYYTTVSRAMHVEYSRVAPCGRPFWWERPLVPISNALRLFEQHYPLWVSVWGRGVEYEKTI